MDAPVKGKADQQAHANLNGASGSAHARGEGQAKEGNDEVRKWKGQSHVKCYGFPERLAAVARFAMDKFREFGIRHLVFGHDIACEVFGRQGQDLSLPLCEMRDKIPCRLKIRADRRL